MSILYNVPVMQRICTATGKEFTVTQQDLDFYDKISPVFAGKKYQIPAPTLCPEARQQRRMTWRGKDYFFRKCSKTGKQCMSIFPPEVDMVTYSEEAFQSDDWDGTEWGTDFDFSRPFFDQFFELWYQTPKQIANAYYSENCEYIINAHKNKNCYLVDEVDRCRDCLYGYNIQDCTNVLCGFYVRKSELCYNLSQAENCYEVLFAHNVHNSSRCAFIENSRNCKNCLFCSGLHNKQYHIFNQPVSKEEFAQKWHEIFCGSQLVLLQAQKRFEEFIQALPVPASIQVNCEDCTGDQMSNSKDCAACFNIDNCRNCTYCTDIHNSKDCYDVHIYEGELLYECLHAGPEGYGQFFSHLAWFCSNTYYSSQLLSCKNVFGCSGLKHQEYCILNKKYSKEEYEVLVGKIIEHMQKTGEWGEFFPSKFSPYGYNQTMAASYFPLAKKEAIGSGFRWAKEEDRHSDSTGVRVPENLKEVEDDVLDTVFASIQSGKKFKITKAELEFHRKYTIPLPVLAPSERMNTFVQSNPRTLYKRQCNQTGADMWTVHSPDIQRPVYTEDVYRQYIK